MDYELSGNGHESSERIHGYTSRATFKPPGAYQEKGFGSNDDIGLFQTPVAKKKQNQNIVAVKDLYELESMKVDRKIKAKKKMKCFTFFIILISVVLVGASFGAGFFVGSLDENEIEATLSPTESPSFTPTGNPTNSPIDDEVFFSIAFAETFDTVDICNSVVLVPAEQSRFDGCLDQLGFYSCQFLNGGFEFFRGTCQPGTLCKCGDNVFLNGNEDPCLEENVDEVAFCSDALLTDLQIIDNPIPLNKDGFFGQANQRCEDDNQFESCISPAMKATCFEGKIDFQPCGNEIACSCNLNEFIENGFDLCDTNVDDSVKCVST